ncbi:MAG: type II and III secretion system protein [Planctomycetes bacterium]|nr:type II and III secretion system protein [Planctomycetota bacterium]
MSARKNHAAALGLAVVVAAGLFSQPVRALGAQEAPDAPATAPPVSAAPGAGMDVEEGRVTLPDGRVRRYYKCRHRPSRDLAQYLELYQGRIPSLRGVTDAANHYDALNTLVITAGAEEWPAIDTLLAIADVPRPQVELDVKVVELAFTREFQIGFEADFAKTTENTDTFWRGFHATFNPDEFLQSQINAAERFRGVRARFTTQGTDSLTDIGLANLDIRALTTTGQAEIHSETKVTTPEGVPARIETKRQIPFQTQQVTGNNIVTSTTFERVGVTLHITPLLIGDDAVLLDVNSNVSAVTGSTVQTAPGISNPVISSRKAETRLSVRDGQTFVFGGLMARTSIDEYTGVPFLSDIPVVGALFRKQRKRTEKREIYFWIKPNILQPLGAETAGPPAG